jgi:outer membrane protein TolC
VNGLSSVLRISDAIFLPLAARRVVSASRAGFQARTNDALLEVAEAYLDLQLASGRLAIAREAADNAERLSEITRTYSETGQGQEADHRRALAELKHQRKTIQLASGQLLVASTNLIRLLVLDARLVVAPVEPAEAVLCLIPEDTPLDELLIRAMQNRPELAQSRELVQAAIVRLKQARLRPFIPSVGATYAGGGEGGGKGPFFGNFGARGDFIVTMFWEVQHLGFGDRAVMRRNAADRRLAELEFAKVGARVAADVASAHEQLITSSLQLRESRETVSEALESLKLNFDNMRQAFGLARSTRPIEVLQPIQALAQARLDYLESVIAYNRSQFRLKRAVGQQP